MQASMPFILRHLHPDNGSEFINYGLVDYCKRQTPVIELSCSRAGKKNDNCHVEQKTFDTIRKLVAEGAKINRFPKDMMDASFKARNELFAELNDTNPDWKKIYAHYEKFLRDEYSWFRLSEMSYDQYMTSIKL